MAKQTIMDRYKSMVELWALASGPDIEIAFHDLRNWSSSIVTIFNGDISGRGIGDGFLPHERTKLKALIRDNDERFLNFRGYVDNDFMIRSSVMAIYDDDGKPIAAVTVNVNITSFINLASYYSVLSYMSDEDSDRDADGGSAELSLTELIDSTLHSIYGATVPELHGLTTFEKIKIIERLKEKKVFMIKGAVSQVAQQLSISESSVYRYLKQLSK